MFKPVGNMVLIKQMPVENKTDWGFITDSADEERTLARSTKSLTS
jgi:co-chaperonin GroES (HSP10)